MTFAAPLYLVGAVALSAAVVALHFLARRSPRARAFPTARFIPDREARAAAPAPRPSDLLLLVLRVAIVLLVGLAFARPQLGSHSATVRVLLLDRSRAVASPSQVVDSAQRWYRKGDVVIVFDSAARVVEDWRDAVLAAGRPVRGSLSAALVAALLAPPAAAAMADSLELVVVSAFAVEEWDSATSAIRARWQGGARLVPVPRAASEWYVEPADVSVDDPLLVAFSLSGSRRGTEIRLRRNVPTAADSTWARATGGALVYWPVDEPAWRLATSDTVGAVAADQALAVAPLERSMMPPPGSPVAVWVDGEPAAVERSLGVGCERDVAIRLPEAGDVALREGVRQLVAELLAPCGGTPRLRRIGEGGEAILRGSERLFAADRLDATQTRRVPAAGTLLGLALLLVVSEPVLRRRFRSE